MFLSSLRIIRFAFQDIWRNLSLSFMTVLILVLMLLSVNTLLVIRLLTNEATIQIKNQIDVSVYFNRDATDKHIGEINAFLKSFPEVTTLTLVSREEVLKQFREQYKDNAEIIGSLDELGENPYGATLIVKTRDTSDYKKIIDALNVPEYKSVIESKTFDDTELAIQKIHTITTQVEQFSYLLTGLFALIAFLIIFNTIRVAIYTQRTEISIKKLVGATNWFVSGPYFFESLLFSIVSVVITCGLLFLSAHFLDTYIAQVFSKSGFLTSYFSSHIVVLLLGQFAAVFALTLFSSSLAMRKYLRV